MAIYVPTGTVGITETLIASAGFRNLPLADYHLRSGSAAIDAGADAGIGFDLDGDPRPFGGGFDIGYDEYAIWKLFLPVIAR